MRPDRPDLPDRPDERDDPLERELPEDLETPDDLEPPDERRTPDDREPLEDLLGALRTLPDDRLLGEVRLTPGDLVRDEPCDRILALGELDRVRLLTPDFLVGVLERVTGALRALLDERSATDVLERVPDDTLEPEPERKPAPRDVERDTVPRDVLVNAVLRPDRDAVALSVFSLLLDVLAAVFFETVPAVPDRTMVRLPSVKLRSVDPRRILFVSVTPFVPLRVPPRVSLELLVRELRVIVDPRGL